MTELGDRHAPVSVIAMGEIRTQAAGGGSVLARREGQFWNGGIITKWLANV